MDIQKFYDPKYMAKYYTDSGRGALKRLALSDRLAKRVSHYRPGADLQQVRHMAVQQAPPKGVRDSRNASSSLVSARPKPDGRP